MKEASAIKVTRDWVVDFVLKHNLCPFAHQPMNENKVRFALIERDIKVEFLKELHLLKKEPKISTSILVCPTLDDDFMNYMNLIYGLEDFLEAEELDEDFQLASFHPKYQFAGTKADDVENLTNRSPHALIHILRGDEMEAAIKQHGNTEQIPIQNIEKMKKLF